jgi:3-dehydroquinate synthase
MEGIKNHIGLFSNPQAVFIIPEFLDTLPENQKINGYAEIIKHSLVYEKHYWEDLSEKSFSEITDIKQIIDWSVEIKNYFITEDPLETGFRKVLNFGHTIGHAVETYSFQNENKSLLHGEAVAIGIICESYISHKHLRLAEEELSEIVQYIKSLYKPYFIDEGKFDYLIELMQHDKKNKRDEVHFTLLTSIGNSLINEVVDIALVKESLMYYKNLFNTQ